MRSYSTVFLILLLCFVLRIGIVIIFPYSIDSTTALSPSFTNNVTSLKSNEIEGKFHVSLVDGFEHAHFDAFGFPISVPLVEQRKDDFGAPVESRRLELLGGVSAFMVSNDHNWLNNGRWDLWSTDKAVSLDHFRQILQCAPHEPDLDGRRGILSLIRLVGGVTQRSIKQACAWIEEPCWPWKVCNDLAEQFISGEQEYPRDVDYFVKLVRIHKGALYLDWPWGSGRIFKRPDFNVIRLFAAVLEHVADIPDSVFFTKTYDRPLFPANFPIPAFSHSPKGDENSDIPFPWPRIINDEVEFYTKQIIGGELIYPNLDPSNDTIWSSRLEKVGFYGMLWEKNPAALGRQVLIDLSILRPDLIEAKFTAANPMNPYNPASDEELFDMKIPRRSKRHLPDNQHGLTGLNATHRPGFIKTMRKAFQKLQVKKDWYIRRFKYLAVISGNTAADRLATFLAHSGSVILLQSTDYLSHFSQRLRPWVHYVPLAFNGADIVEKILWLRAHDRLARRIAINGWVFGKSYLRLEDYYCYTASAMVEVARVEQPDSLVHFNSTPISSPWLKG